MKRSEINAVIKKFEALMNFRPTWVLRQRSGRIRDMNMMRYGITCWDGM